MTPYPASLPVDAINVIVNDIKNKAVATDRANFAKAVWELEGYGLKVGLGDPTPVTPVTPVPPVAKAGPPLSDDEVVAHLESLVNPDFNFIDAPDGVCQAGMADVLALIPWQAILKWALTALLASL
jgi:hypothetical protein